MATKDACLVRFRNRNFGHRSKPMWVNPEVFNVGSERFTKKHAMEINPYSKESPRAFGKFLCSLDPMMEEYGLERFYTNIPVWYRTRKSRWDGSISRGILGANYSIPYVHIMKIRSCGQDRDPLKVCTIRHGGNCAHCNYSRIPEEHITPNATFYWNLWTQVMCHNVAVRLMDTWNGRHVINLQPTDCSLDKDARIVGDMIKAERTAQIIPRLQYKLHYAYCLYLDQYDHEHERVPGFFRNFVSRAPSRNSLYDGMVIEPLAWIRVEEANEYFKRYPEKLPSELKYDGEDAPMSGVLDKLSGIADLATAMADTLYPPYHPNIRSMCCAMFGF